MGALGILQEKGEKGIGNDVEQSKTAAEKTEFECRIFESQSCS